MTVPKPPPLPGQLAPRAGGGVDDKVTEVGDVEDELEVGFPVVEGAATLWTKLQAPMSAASTTRPTHLTARLDIMQLTVANCRSGGVIP